MADLFENPLGLDGFEFVEFCAPEKGVLEPVFAAMGHAPDLAARAGRVSAILGWGMPGVLVFNACTTEEYLHNLRSPGVFRANMTDTDVIATTMPSLTINGGIGDDTVNMNGDITFAANASLDLDLQNDDVTPGIDIVTVAASADEATGTHG